MTQKVGIGVVGLGRMGQVYANHVGNQIDAAKLIAVADSNPAATAQYSHITTYSDFAALLDNPDIQGVIIATPTHTHHALVIAAAEKGKAIFCEKPTALTLKATDEMLAAVKKAGVLFQVGFMRRFDAGYVAAKQQIEAGAIGTPVMIRSVSRDPRRTSLEFANPANSGGMVMDMSIHDIDVARWLMNDDIVRVYTEAGVLVYPELAEVGDVDNAMVLARFAKGGIGNFDSSRNAVYGYDIQCDVLGSDGAIQVGYLRETPILRLDREGVHHDVVPHFPERFGKAYTTQIEHFVDCLVNDKTPIVTPEDARAALQVGIAATVSQHEGRPVDVSEIQ